MSFFGTVRPGTHSSWAWVNQQNALATIHDDTKYIFYRHPGLETSINHWSAYMTPITVAKTGGAFHFEIALSALHVAAGSSIGLATYNSGTAAMMPVVVTLDNIGFQNVVKAGDQPTHGTAMTSTDAASVSRASPVTWLRLTATAEQVLTDISMDGVYWRRIGTRSKVWDPTHFGIYSTVASAGAPAMTLGTVFHIQQYEGAPA